MSTTTTRNRDRGISRQNRRENPRDGNRDQHLFGRGSDEDAVEAALAGLNAGEFSRLLHTFGGEDGLDDRLEDELSGGILARCREIVHQKRLVFDPAYRDRYLGMQASALGEASLEHEGRSVLFAAPGDPAARSMSALGRLKAACAGASTDDELLWTTLAGLEPAERHFIQQYNPDDILGILRRDRSERDVRRVETVLAGGATGSSEILRQAVDGRGADDRLIQDELDRVLQRGLGVEILGDAALLGEIREDISPGQYQILRQALHSGQFPALEGLRGATDMAGTDEELVWQLCREHAAEWYPDGGVLPEGDRILQS